MQLRDRCDGYQNDTQAHERSLTFRAIVDTNGMRRPHPGSDPDCRFQDAWINGQCVVEIIIPDIALDGGIWTGSDSSSRAVTLYISRFSSFQFVDGTTAADCTFSGTLVERQTLSIAENCTTTSGLQFQDVLQLTFDPLYERDTSLLTIAGMYRSSAGSNMDIAADSTSGCISNGQIRVTVSTPNMYVYEFEISNCVNADAIWNG